MTSNKKEQKNFKFFDQHQYLFCQPIKNFSNERFQWPNEWGKEYSHLYNLTLASEVKKNTKEKRSKFA